jgi:tryptophan-rich sensory protein
LSLFLVQLGLNGAWSLIFFGAHAPTWALLEIASLWLAIVLTIRAFRRIDAVAAYLLLPYLAWVTFATALNAAIVRLN